MNRLTGTIATILLLFLCHERVYSLEPAKAFMIERNGGNFVLFKTDFADVCGKYGEKSNAEQEKICLLQPIDENISELLTSILPPEIQPIPALSACDSIVLPPISGVGLSGNQAYFTEPNGMGIRYAPGTVYTVSDTLYAYDQTAEGSDSKTVSITITKRSQFTLPLSFSACGYQILPTIMGSNLPGTEAYFASPGGMGMRFKTGDTLRTSGTYFVYAADKGCISEDTIAVTIRTKPIIRPYDTIRLCGTSFTLPPIIGQNISVSAAYYTQPNGQGTRLQPGATINQTQTLYAFDDNGLCTDEIPVHIILFPPPSIRSIPNILSCGFYVLPPIIGQNLSGSAYYATSRDGAGAKYDPGDTIRTSVLLYAYDRVIDCRTENAFSVNIIPSVKISIAETGSLSCNDSENGAINLTLLNGAGPFTFDWNDDNFDTKEDLTGVSPGFYSVTVTDVSGCKDSAFITITAPAPLLLSCANTRYPTTQNQTNGQISTLFSGGVPPYRISWTGNSTGITLGNNVSSYQINGLRQGTYTITLTDSKGCTTTCSNQLQENNCTLSINPVVNHVSCDGKKDGQIQLNVSGGTAPYTYNWNAPEYNGQRQATDLSPGMYAITISDADQCNINIQLSITSPPALQLFCGQQKPANPLTNNGGVAYVRVRGGSNGYALTWSGPVSGFQNAGFSGDTLIDDLPRGTYRVTVTDRSGCIQECELEITNPDCKVSAAIEVLKPISCNGLTNGELTATIAGSVGALIYNWTGGSAAGSQDVYGGLGAGIYRLIVSDQIGCTDTSQYVLNSPLPFQTTCTVLKNNTAKNGATGEVVIRFQGGSNSKRLQWIGGQPGETALITNDSIVLIKIPAGTYVYEAIDANGCRSTCSFTITEPTCSVSNLITLRPPGCSGSASGRIILTTSGGKAPYNYNWQSNPSNNRALLSNIQAGVYRVTVTDADGCTDIQDITLPEPQPLAINCIPISPATTVGGRQGRAGIVVAGGAGPYQITVDGPVPGTYTLDNPDTLFLSTLSAGNYTVEVRDANRCVGFCDFFTTEPPCTILFSMGLQNPRCAGGSDGIVTTVIKDATPPYRFDWNVDTYDGQAIALGVPAGIYRVRVTDASGCESTNTEVLIDPPVLNIRCDEPRPVSTRGAKDGGIKLAIEGGTPPFSISLNRGSVTSTFLVNTQQSLNIDTLLAGDYSVIITDNGGCSKQCGFSIPQPACAFMLESTFQAPLCTGSSDGRITLLATGGMGTIQYNWNVDSLDGKTTANSLAESVYKVTATDEAGCVDSVSVRLQTANTITLKCAAEKRPSAPDLPNGSIQIIVSEGLANKKLIIQGPSQGKMTNVNDTTILIENIRAGSYRIFVVSETGCSTDCTTDLVAENCSLALAISYREPLCVNEATGTIQVSVQGASGQFTWQWNKPGLPLNPENLSAGIYTLTVTDEKGCRDTAIVDLVSPQPLLLTWDVLEQQPRTSDTTGNAVIRYSGGVSPYKIGWYGMETDSLTRNSAGIDTLKNLRVGAYQLIVQDANGCTFFGSFSIVSGDCKLKAALIVDSLLCSGEYLLSVKTKGATQPLTYDWNNNQFDNQSTGVRVLPGSYQVTVKESETCLATANLVVTDSVFSATIQLIPEACQGSSGKLFIGALSGRTPPYSVFIDGVKKGETSQDSITIPNIPVGAFSVQISSRDGCSRDSSFEVRTIPVLELLLPADTSIFLGSSVTIEPVANFEISKWEWNPKTTVVDSTRNLFTLTPKQTTLYTLQAYDASGCIATDDIQITVKEVSYIFFPTAFSPNGDGENDFFTGFSNDQIDRIEVLQIYNRWGEPVFMRENINPGDESSSWDGTMRGKEAPADTYVYFARIRLAGTDKVISSRGEISLIR